MKKYYLLLIACLIFFANTLKAQILNDTIFLSYKIENPAFSANLDSLLRLYSVKEEVRKIIPNPEIFKYIIFDSTATEFDSLSLIIAEKNQKTDRIFPNTNIIKQRVDSLNTVIKLEFNEHVNKFICYFTKEKRIQIEILLGLSENYLPIFDKILAEERLPAELKYLPMVQSALFERAISPSGSSGMWQINYKTAKLYDLEISSFVDERRNPRKAINAVVKYFKEMYEVYRDWNLVIAAYHCEPSNINKAIARSGGIRNYWELYNMLPSNKREILPAFYAMVYLNKYYKKHHIKPRKINIITEGDTVQVTEKLHLAQVAEYFKIPYDRIRDLNSIYKTPIIPYFNKPHQLVLPKGYGKRFLAEKQKIYNYRDSLYFSPKPAVVDVSVRRKNTYTSIKNRVKIYYTVKEGDNSKYIASWFNVTKKDIDKWNNINNNMLKVGQKLLIYVPKNLSSEYRKLEEMTFSQKQQLVKSRKTRSSRYARTYINTNDPNYIYYRVRKGDNMWDIAKKFPGVSYKQIMRLNGLSRYSRLKIGQKLRIKKK